MSHPGGPKTAPRPPQEAAKCFKTALRAAQDQPKTLKIAQIDKTQKPKPQFADDKKAGGRR